MSHSILSKLLLGFTGALLFMGCTSSAKHREVVRKQRIAYEAKLKQQKESAEILKERNGVLSAKLKRLLSEKEAGVLPPVPFEKSAKAEEKIATVENAFTPARSNAIGQKLAQVATSDLAIAKKAPEASVATPFSPHVTSEQYLYSKIIQSFHKSNQVDLLKSLELLQKSESQSIFLDNAVYLSGLLYLKRGDHKQALEQFDRVILKYPLGNKVVSSLFAKAVVFRKAQRIEEARRTFLRVKQMYPGSPEANRVDTEIKLLGLSVNQNHNTQSEG